MTTRVYLLRHGATEANRAVPYRLQGSGIDLPLDALGNEQARRAAEALAALGLEAVYASPLLRAMETARWVARAHGLGLVAVAELAEADVGRWEGLTWEQARERDPEWHDRFHANPGAVPYPGGESFLDVGRRVSPAIAGLAAAHPGARIAVVGHNVVNRAYLAPLLGLTIEKARALRQANGGINLIEYEEEQIRVVTLNACLHLEGLETLGAPPAPPAP
jgi:broad specificity phosphatase PhoE